MTNTLFTEMSLPRKVWESVGGAIIMGAITGLLLGINMWAYIALVILSMVGGIPAAFQHRRQVGAALRGLLAGGVWASTLLVVLALSNSVPTVEPPRPHLVLIAVSALVTAAIGALTWKIGARKLTSAWLGLESVG